MTPNSGLSESCASNDMVGRKIACVVWGLPGVLLLVGLFWSEARGWLWTPALLVAGVACLVNAGRCGRLHCYFTGPLFLLAAMATLLRGLEILPLPWSWIAIAVIGGSVLACIPEWLWGKYIQRA